MKFRLDFPHFYFANLSELHVFIAQSFGSFFGCALFGCFANSIFNFLIKHRLLLGKINEHRVFDFLGQIFEHIGLYTTKNERLKIRQSETGQFKLMESFYDGKFLRGHFTRVSFGVILFFIRT